MGVSLVPPLETDAPLKPAVARAAALWFVTMSSGEASDMDHRALQVWRKADPEHERAWQRTQQLGRQFAGLAPTGGMAVLDRPRSEQRRRAAKQLALLLIAGSGSWAMHRHMPWQEWTADYRTAIGERRSISLADGSSMIMNTDSAVNVLFTPQERRIKLVRGEILIATAPEHDVPYRPLRVATAEGVLTALGTRFTVQQLDQSSRLGVQEGAVEIRPVLAQAGMRVLHAGEETIFDRQRIADTVDLDATRIAWKDGMLFADRMPLSVFVAELARYRPGMLRCDSAVADLRISGSFPLTDTDRILQSLVDTLPVRVAMVTRYWVQVVPA